MATSAQDIVRILQAAGGFIPDVDSNEYYVVLEESNELSERHWFGSQLASETLIALDIRTNSPAVYAVHDDIRSVFCVGENNALRLYTLREDEWQKVDLAGNGNILVHPSSRLSGCVDGNDSLVFFEDFKGHIRGIRVQRDGRWRFLRPLSVKSVPGNPHFAQVHDNIIYLSYVHQDGLIHQTGMRIASNVYYDYPLQGTTISNAPIENLIAGIHAEVRSEIRDETQNGPRDELEFYLLALTKKTERRPVELVRIDDNGTWTVMGKIVHGLFRHTSDEESNYDVHKAIGSAVRNATGGSGGRNITGATSGRPTAGRNSGSHSAGRDSGSHSAGGSSGRQTAGGNSGRGTNRR
ncbi:hypothetical protein HDV57DRAFT_480262 [Trichoderma longibrachiatum]